MTLEIWDTTTMERRPATQQDINELEIIRTHYSRFLALLQQDRAELLEEIKASRSRAGMPNDLMVDRPAPKEDAHGRND